MEWRTAGGGVKSHGGVLLPLSLRVVIEESLNCCTACIIGCAFHHPPPEPGDALRSLVLFFIQARDLAALVVVVSGALVVVINASIGQLSVPITTTIYRSEGMSRSE